MKKAASVLAILLTVLLLAGCGSKVETKKLVGSWYCDIDVTERMNMAAAESMGISTEDSSGVMTLRMCFSVEDDGAYTIGYDVDAIYAALEAYTDALRVTVTEEIYAAAEEEGFTKEEYDETMKNAGISIEDMVSAVFTSISAEELVSLLAGRMDMSTGCCKAEDGKLYLAETADGLTEDAGYVNYTLDGDTMSWTDNEGELSGQLTAEEQALIQFPMVWTKQAAE